MSNINRADLAQDVYRPRGGSIRQWAHLRMDGGEQDNPYGEADELARIANDRLNRGGDDIDSF